MAKIFTKQTEFRAWDANKEEMIYEYDEDNDRIYTRLDSDGELIIGRMDSGEDWYELEELQFIGIIDKKGKKIYEGDIVKMSCWEERKVYKDAKKKSCEGIFIVETYLGSFGYSFRFHGISGYACPTHLQMHHNNAFEVLGNIYEHPKLLNKYKSADKGD